MCGVCTYRNPKERTLCQMCMAPKPKPPPPSWSCPTCTYRNAGTAQQCALCSSPSPEKMREQAKNMPYQCTSCSVINDPRLHPNKCGVCGKVRQQLHLCTWKTYDQLPKPMHTEVYKFLPDLLATIHILWPRVTLIYSGSAPSMTT
mmetsp:Transcript_26898/g.52143  ORF Transcript_26898/g.52143 Transcript_26898/m.52143 type:complete len:146 (-) Transcript_26898:121-558(-)